MSKVLLTSFTEDELSNLIAEIIRPIVSSEIKSIIASNNSSPPKQDEFISRKEAAAILKISTVTLTKLVRQNIITAKILGGSYRFSKLQIFKYLNSK
jgi:excisionase family DNA binding protein